MATDADGRIFVANFETPAVVAFGSQATGNVKPVVRIAGSHAGLLRPFALAFDSTGRLLVADEDVRLVIFAPGADGERSHDARRTLRARISSALNDFLTIARYHRA